VNAWGERGGVNPRHQSGKEARGGFRFVVYY